MFNCFTKRSFFTCMELLVLLPFFIEGLLFFISDCICGGSSGSSSKNATVIPWRGGSEVILMLERDAMPAMCAWHVINFESNCACARLTHYKTWLCCNTVTNALISTIQFSQSLLSITLFNGVHAMHFAGTYLLKLTDLG